MKDTILKYVKVLGNYSWQELAFNEVDALILAVISYNDFTGIVTLTKIVTIKQAYEAMQKKFNLKSKDRFLNNAKILFKELANSPRYGNLKLENYQKINTKHEQFGAITIRLDSKTIFISFEGTEDNLVGWEEDFRLCHMYPVPAQKSAWEYLEQQQKGNKYIYIGGHSKGGNLSMAAGMNAHWWVRHKIKKIYNFDGPGFMIREITSKSYKKIKKKIITYIPEESIIGVLLENTSQVKVIKSYAKKTLAHDAFTWNCYGPILTLGTLSDYSYNIKRKVKQIMASYDNTERKIFVDTFFKILYNSGYTEKSELNKISFNKVKNILKETHKLTKEEKSILVDILKILGKKEDDDEKKDSNNK